MTTTATAAAAAHAPVESPAERRRRLRTTVLFCVFSAVMVLLALTTNSGTAEFALSSPFDDTPLPSIRVPAQPTAIVLTLIAIGITILQAVRGLRGRTLTYAGAAFGIAFILTFMCWAAAGKSFPLTNQLQGSLNLATPLILGALAGVLCERSGVINIAIEGQFLVGAFAAAVVGTIAGSGVAGMVAAAIAGLLLGLLLAVFSIKYLVNQVVLGVVLNVFAIGLTGFLFDRFLQSQPTEYNSPPILSRIAIPGLSEIPVIGQVLFNQTLLVYLMYVLVVLVNTALFRTKWGLRVRAVGEHPKAADTVGINVLRTRYRAVLVGSMIAGLGGAFFTVGFTGAFGKEMTAGQGFIALAALIMGRWHPIGATVAALFFGFANQLQSQLQIIQTPIPSQLLLMAPYLATIVAVAGLVGRVRAPKADGEPYVKQ
jgi:general nucleoside transport system permease protein